MVFSLDKLGSISIGTKYTGLVFQPFLSFLLKLMAKFKCGLLIIHGLDQIALDYIHPFNMDTQITCFPHYKSHFPQLLQISISSNIMWDSPSHSVSVCNFPMFFIINSLTPLLDVHMSYYILFYSFIIFTSFLYLICMDNPYPLCTQIDHHLC